MTNKFETKRLELHEILCGVLGSRNVYFQPPESIKMKYPAIVYTRYTIQNGYADNNVYNQSNAYQVTVIDKEPDSNIVEKISALPFCRFVRHFETDNLNHDVFYLYY